MPCITLLSDLGLKDASVAAAKGILTGIVPGALIADLTHEITPFHTAGAAYALKGAYKNFPKGTIHIILFDIFSERMPKVMLSEMNGQYFICADNNVIPLALQRTAYNSWLGGMPEKENSFSNWVKVAGNIAQLLQKNTPAQLGYQRIETETSPTELPETNGTYFCNVVHIDQYENVVLDITQEQFDSISLGRPFRLQYMQVEEITEISRNYSDAREGHRLCRFNRNGHLEICINRGKAASLFGFRIGSRHNDIKLLFG